MKRDKRVFFILLVIISLGLSACSSQPAADPDKESKEEKLELKTDEKTEEEVEEKEEPEIDTSVPKDYQSALKKARVYLDTMPMSKAGIFKQLTSLNMVRDLLRKRHNMQWTI